MIDHALLIFGLDSIFATSPRSRPWRADARSPARRRSWAHAARGEPAGGGARADRRPAARRTVVGPCRSARSPKPGSACSSTWRRLAARLAGARVDLDRFARGDAGTLSVGSFQSASALPVPRIFSRFRTERPDVEIELVESTTDLAALDEVRSGTLDFGFCLLPIARRSARDDDARRGPLRARRRSPGGRSLARRRR